MECLETMGTHAKYTIFRNTNTTNTMIRMDKNYKPIILTVNSGSFPCSSELYELILPPESLEWIIERVIWIAFFKNKNNQDCLVSSLPKSLVYYLLSF